MTPPSEAELVEAVWQQRARATRRLNRRMWIKRAGAIIAGLALVLLVLALAAFGVFVVLFHGVDVVI